MPILGTLILTLTMITRTKDSSEISQYSPRSPLQNYFVLLPNILLHLHYLSLCIPNGGLEIGQFQREFNYFTD